MCKIELDLGNLASAELLIAELDDVPPAFSEALEALREAQKQSTEARKRLKDLEHNLDITVGSQRRTHLMVLFVILLFGTASIATYFTDGLIVTTHKASFLTSFIIIASTVVFAIVGRDTLFHTSISRRMVAFFFTGCAGVLISRSLGFFLPIPVQAVFIFDMIIVGTAFTLAGFAIDTLLFISAAFYYIGIIISIIWPSVSYLMMIFALGFSTAWAGITWQRARKKHIPRH